MLLSRYKIRALWILAPFLLIYSVAGCAFESIILVANSSHYSLLHRIETAIYSEPSPHPQLIRIETEELTHSSQFDVEKAYPCKLVVAVGSHATKAVLETKPEHAILSILIRKNAYDELVEAYKSKHGKAPNITAVFINQPFERQFNLISSIMPSTDDTPLKIGILLGPNSVMYKSLLEETIKSYPHKLQIISVKNKDNVTAAFDVLLEDVNVIMALPDSAIYNTRTARGLLLSAYRKKVPIIGFSKTYVSNGALAAVYSTPKQVASQTADMIREILESDSSALPKYQFPNQYSVAVNYQVGRSLSMVLDNEAGIHFCISQKEGCDENIMSAFPQSLSSNTIRTIDNE